MWAQVKDRDATGVIRRLAERQHGVVAVRQLVDRGVGGEIARIRHEAGLLIPIHQGVYALGHRKLSREGEWMAAVLACGPGAVLSHGSAAELWGIRGSRGEIEVLRRSGGGCHEGLRIHQTRRLDSDDMAEERGISVTSIERTMLDMAGRLGSRQIERMVVAADRTGKLSWSRLEKVLGRRKGRKGAGRLRRIAAEVDPRAIEARSVAEVDFLALVRGYGLPMPEVNVLVADHLVDFLWPAERVVVEIDGYAFHSDRPAFERDHTTDVDLVAAGYDVHHATYRMLHRDPEPFIANVRRSLHHRSTAALRTASSFSSTRTET